MSAIMTLFISALGLCQKTSKFPNSADYFFTFSKAALACSELKKPTKAIFVVNSSLLTRLKLEILPNLANVLLTYSLVMFLARSFTYKLLIPKSEVLFY